jgi:hypothetical protein
MKLHPSLMLRHAFNFAERKVETAAKPYPFFCPITKLSFFIFILLFNVSAFANHPFDIELKVWSSQSFEDPFCSDEPIDIYFRVNRPGYITVYQINPCGGGEILYPLACHRWMPVYPGRTYRLIDLSPDLDFFYDSAEGHAYIGLVATEQPIDIVPWIEAGFRHHGLVFGKPERVVVDVDFRLVIDRVLADVRIRLGNACAPAYYVAPIYVRPRVVRYRPPVIVWPTPPRHKSYPPKWGQRDGYHPPERTYESQPYGRSPEPPEKRPFRRRGNESSEKRYDKIPDSGKSNGPEKAQPERSDSDKHSVKKSGEVKVKNDSRGSGSESGESSQSSSRRVKKPRN